MASAAPRMHARQPAVRLIALPRQSGTSFNSKVSVGFAAGSGLQNQVLLRNGAAPEHGPLSVPRSVERIPGIRPALRSVIDRQGTMSKTSHYFNSARGPRTLQVT